MKKEYLIVQIYNEQSGWVPINTTPNWHKKTVVLERDFWAYAGAKPRIGVVSPTKKLTDDTYYAVQLKHPKMGWTYVNQLWSYGPSAEMEKEFLMECGATEA